MQGQLNQSVIRQSATNLLMGAVKKSIVIAILNLIFYFFVLMGKIISRLENGDFPPQLCFI